MNCAACGKEIVVNGEPAYVIGITTVGYTGNGGWSFACPISVQVHHACSPECVMEVARICMNDHIAPVLEAKARGIEL